MNLTFNCFCSQSPGPAAAARYAPRIQSTTSNRVDDFLNIEGMQRPYKNGGARGGVIDRLAALCTTYATKRSTYFS